MHASNIIRFALLIAACAQALPTQPDTTTDVAPDATWEENALESTGDILLPEEELEETAAVEKREAAWGRKPAGPSKPKPTGPSRRPDVTVEVDPLAPLQLVPWITQQQQQQQPPAPVQKREAAWGRRPAGPSKPKPTGGSSGKPSWEVTVDPLAPLQLVPWITQQQQQQQPPAPVQKREAAWGRKPAGPSKPTGPSRRPDVNIEVDPLAPLQLLPWITQQQQQQPPAPVQKREAAWGRRPAGPSKPKPTGPSRRPDVNIEVDPLAPLQLLPWITQQQQQQQPPAPVQKREAAWGRRPAGPSKPKPTGPSRRPDVTVEVDPLAPLQLVPWITQQQQQQQPPAPVQKREAAWGRGPAGPAKPKPTGGSKPWEITVDPLAPLPLIPLIQQQQQQQQPPAPAPAQ